jgi:hypothetical protein
MSVTIENLTDRPTGEVKKLVRYALRESIATNVLVLVVPTGGGRGGRPVAFSGWASPNPARSREIAESHKAIWRKTKPSPRYMVVVRVGPDEAFPIEPFHRHALHDYQDWREALVGTAAHELRHIEDYVAHRSPRGAEARCEAFAKHVLAKWRRDQGREAPAVTVVKPPLRAVVKVTDDDLELLDCGHVIDPPRWRWERVPTINNEGYVTSTGWDYRAIHDAKRRRCRKCLPAGAVAA